MRCALVQFIVSGRTYIIPVSLINIFHREPYFNLARIIFINADNLNLIQLKIRFLRSYHNNILADVYLPTLGHPSAPHQH